MTDPARNNSLMKGNVICHAYPLACSGVSAARSAPPKCTPRACYLFEGIHPDPKGSEL